MLQLPSLTRSLRPLLRRLLPCAAACAAVCALVAADTLPARAEEKNTNVLGRQSQNEGIPVLPVPAGKAPTIDGDLADWELSGRIHSFADWDLRDSNSVETAAMYDKDALYLAFKWRDPSPMLSAINPDFNPSEGWKADAIQMRLTTDRNIWITTWYYTAEKVPVMHVSYWKDDRNNKQGQDIHLHRAKAGGNDLGEGIQMFYKMGEDKKSFVQEVKIPWKVLYTKSTPKVEPGLTMKMGLEFLWGDDKEGKLTEHRYADNMQPGTTSREFYWTAVRSWGDLKLVGDQKVATREYSLPKTTLPGTIPVKFTVPESAARMTVVIEDEQGNRVRNLVADVQPAEYQSGMRGAERQIEVMWDGLDDAGKLVPVGKYKARGLTRGSLDATFDACFYNPGTPPWYTLDGTGGFGSNHASPEGVARSGDVMLCSYVMSEGGHALIGINAVNDRKLWGENRGAHQLAADDKYAYTITREVWTKEKKTRLYRYLARDGSYAPFTQDGKPRPFELEVAELVGDPITEAKADPDENTNLAVPRPADDLPGALAVGKTQIAIAMPDGRVVLLNKESAVMEKTLKPGKAVALAFNPKSDDLVGVIDGKVVKIDKNSGSASALFSAGTPAVATPVGLAFADDGNLAVVDGGSDSDVKVYNPSGEMTGTIGKKGGRPVRGTFEPQAMMRVNRVAFDAKGRIWAAERTNFPRRFSIWKPDGSLDRDFIGSTGYAATCTFLHDTNPDLAYCGPVEMKLDRAKGTWQVTRILWHPNEGEPFTVDTGSHAHPQRFRSKASGEWKEYMFVPADRPWEAAVVFIEKGDYFAPVAAIGKVISTVKNVKGKPQEEPRGLFAGKNYEDGYYWNDLNGDHKMQADELKFVDAEPLDKQKKNAKNVQYKPALNSFGGWGTRMSSDDLSFYTSGITAYKPTGFGKDGSPRYGPEGTTTLAQAGGGDIVPLPGRDMVAQLNGGSVPRSGGVDGLRGIDLKTGKVMWTYPNPYHSVHGSHRAPMAKPGMLVGPLKIMGTAVMEKGDGGTVFAIRGNLGEDYFFTHDGLYIGALFQDCRRPTENLPDAGPDALKGRSLANFSEGGEPFSGWFGQQSDGKARIGTSIGRNSGFTVVLSGLNSVKRFTGPELDVTAADLARADADNIARSSASKEKKTYIIRKVAKPMTIDGKLADWSKIEEFQAGHTSDPHNAAIRLAYDADNLYAAWEVDDPTPMLNSGKDKLELFKSGDSVDLQLGTRPGTTTDRKDPVAGDIRLNIAEVAGSPVALLMVPVNPAADKAAAKTYSSPVSSARFDQVEVLANVKVAVTKSDKGYIVEAAIPLSAIGLKPEPGLEIRGDAGIITSDTAGIINTARIYWSNKNTGLVNDVWGEAILKPNEWGKMQFSD